MIPLNHIKIKGVVSNKFGHPVHGVRVSAGNYATYTNLKGQYTLPVAPQRDYQVKVSKWQSKFSKPVKHVRADNRDIIPLNFLKIKSKTSK